MNQPKIDLDNTISPKGRKASADELGCDISDLEVVSVNGGYSRNRRSIVGYKNRWIFAKEVDLDLLSSDGVEELGWLSKDYECTKALRQIVPEIVPEWGKLVSDGHVFLMPSYRSEDGWLWFLPSDTDVHQGYIQAVIDASKKLEDIKFDQDVIDKLKLNPYFRDKLAMDDGLNLIIKNKDIRNQLKNKYNLMLQDKLLAKLYPAIRKMSALLQDKRVLKDLSDRAAALIDQSNDCLGHCDVRSDNIAYNPSTGQVKFVDWNWASLVTKGFGPTEFLVDMSRRGADVTPWLDELNIEMLAAMVGFYAKRCLDDPLALGNILRDVQAQSAAVALNLYDLVMNQ